MIGSLAIKLRSIFASYPDMPPKKRKATATKASTPPQKKIRIEEDDVAELEATLPSRPKRTSIGTPQYRLNRTYQTNGKSQGKEDVAPSSDPPKRRGRPPKDPALVTSVDDTTTARKAVARGRPPTKTVSEAPATKKAASKATGGAPVEKKRGRPPKVTEPDAVKEATGKKTAATKKQTASKATKATTKITSAAIKAKTHGKRGRPSKNTVPTTVSLQEISADGLSDIDHDDDEQVDGTDDRQYWLMKAEPNDRFEKGINVKFGIDDLAVAQAPEPWDGVRNHGARNNMRAMRKNDLAFFYHSNCPVPGIVGVMRIVQEHTPDQSAFNPNHPYYDPKSSPSSPTWDCVHVEFVRKFDTMVTLKMLQENKMKLGELAKMQLLRQGRLSVSAVTSAEWRFILGMANEDLRVGENETAPAVTDGYESDTDGEVNEGPREELNGEIAGAVIENGHEDEDKIDENEKDVNEVMEHVDEIKESADELNSK